MASIETITSPSDCKIFYCTEMLQFLQAVSSNGLPHHTHFPYALASFSRSGKHYSYVAFGEIHRLPKLLPASSICMKTLLLFSRIQLIFRISSDQVETLILSLPKYVTYFRFIAVASRSVNCYQIRTSSLTYVRGGASYPSGYLLPLLCSTSFSALALVHVLSVALLRPVLSILLSLASDASSSVGILALRFHLLLKFFRRHTCRCPSSRKFLGSSAKRLL